MDFGFVSLRGVSLHIVIVSENILNGIDSSMDSPPLPPKEAVENSPSLS